MSCNSQICQSNCYKNDAEQPEHLSPQNDCSSNNEERNLCIKCKANDSISSGGRSNSDEARFCADCFTSNVYGKFRLAVTSHALITPSDNVLVAFSGGPSSRVALQFVHELQLRAQRNFNASKDRSLRVFGVGVVFVDESAVYHVPCEKVDDAVGEMNLVVSNLAPPAKQLHVVRIEDIYSPLDNNDGNQKLADLLNYVNDTTGKEDLLIHLRMLALQKFASENGYSRLILGSCTSRIACHVLAATVKGKGYSLSADIQYVDSSWEVPVVLPLRDCTAQELNLICHIDGLKTVELLNSPPTGINGLVSSFMALLQSSNAPIGDQNLKVRKLQMSDKDKGFIELLQQLTHCDPISDEKFEERYNEITANGEDHIICVIEDENSRKIVATGSVFIEKKFIRNCGKVGHIEDVVVDSGGRGRQFGKKIVEFLTDHARLMGCYKVILDCSVENLGFYEKWGFKQKEIQMVKYFT